MNTMNYIMTDNDIVLFSTSIDFITINIGLIRSDIPRVSAGSIDIDRSKGTVVCYGSAPSIGLKSHITDSDKATTHIFGLL